MKRIWIIILFVSISQPVNAGGLIRDAEIEATLRQIANPIFEAAGLEPDHVRIFIVQDDAINAFVAGGQNLFLHTGLINAMEDPSMLMGVIAHEAGHITGGHLARGAEQIQNAQIGMVLGYILGAAAAAGGGGDAGAAVIGGSSQIANRLMLAFSRTNEQSADQSALATLDAMGVSASGMLKTFELLRRKERMFNNLDPYAVTHPLSAERITYVRSHINTAGIPEGEYPKALNAPFARMQAKLYAFMNIAPKTTAKYPESDVSVAARMARAIAYYKVPDAPKALAAMNALIKDVPNDAYLYDLKGQIAFENSRIDEAIAAYTRAVELMPKNALLLTSLAEAHLAKAGKTAAQKALDALERALVLDKENGRSWNLMATAQGRLGNQAEASLALAEQAALAGDADATAMHAARALKALPEGSPKRIHAEDLKLLAARLKQEKS
jgi:predicted Zn-dependent protease